MSYETTIAKINNKNQEIINNGQVAYSNEPISKDYLDLISGVLTKTETNFFESTMPEVEVEPIKLPQTQPSNSAGFFNLEPNESQKPNTEVTPKRKKLGLISRISEGIQKRRLERNPEVKNPRKSRIKKIIGATAALAVLAAGVVFVSSRIGSEEGSVLKSNDRSEVESNISVWGEAINDSSESTALNLNSKNNIAPSDEAKIMFAWIKDHPGIDPEVALNNLANGTVADLTNIVKIETFTACSNLDRISNTTKLWLGDFAC